MDRAETDARAWKTVLVLFWKSSRADGIHFRRVASRRPFFFFANRLSSSILSRDPLVGMFLARENHRDTGSLSEVLEMSVSWLCDALKKLCVAL